MVVHIVMFKFKEESKSLNIEQVQKRLAILSDELEVVKLMEVGVDFIGSERSYDLSLYSQFDSKEDLKSYATDSKHLKVVEFIKSVTIDIKAVDYII